MWQQISGRHTMLKSIFLLLLVLISLKAIALETDQYMTWKTELEDSTREVNEFINDKAQEVLNEINGKQPWDVTCRQAHEEIVGWHSKGMDVIVGIEKWIYENPLLDKFPKNLGSKLGVVKSSIYADSWLFKLKIFGINVKINGVTMGIDKLGHLIETGHAYYKKYQKQIKKGKTHEEALKKAIHYGIRTEKSYYGYMVSGIFSFGDLEANYRGLQLNNNFCHGDDPYLEYKNGMWNLRRGVDLRDYINPYFDETYSGNTYTKRRWKRVKKNLKKYCELKDSELVQTRLANYNEVAKPSESLVYLRSLVAKKKIRDPKKYSLDVACQKEAQ